jgi:predicted CXXCH cytochrome family protein
MAVFVVVFVALVGTVSSRWSSYHDFEGNCLDCHLTRPAPGEPPGTFIKDITAMCNGCHADMTELSHPVDITPTVPVPASMPLDWKGQITCVTCHPVHKKGFGPFRLRSSASGQGFCILCHGDFDQALHKVSLGTAHVKTSTGALLVPSMMEDTLDAMSVKCLSCHDAVFGSDSLVSRKAPGSSFFHNREAIGVSHPIGVSYVAIRQRSRGAYRPVAELPSEIKLFGGQVGCGSCHNPYSKRHDELVMSNEGSALCLACHVK